MPTGIILSSGSQGATQEAVEAVLAKHGYEPDKPEVTPTEPVEPKREDFESDDAFAEAKEEFEAKQEESAEEAERKETERTHRPSRRQRAIDKATKALQEKNKQLEERLAALEGKKSAEEPKLKEPKRDDFKSDAEFEEARDDYRYKVRRAKEDSEAAQKAVMDRLKENYENYKTQVEAFKEEHDDWDEVTSQPIPIHESVYLAVQEQENGAQVTYYLGKHPDYARKLADMSPLSAVMEVGRLSERLKTGAARPAEAGSGGTTKPKPKLPEPVKPVSTSATSSSLSSAEAAKNRDYRAFKTAQRMGR